MATLSIPYSFSDGTTIVAAQHNSNFNAVKAFVDSLSAGDNFDANAIETASINDLAITGAKIAGQAVTLDKLASAVANALNPTGVIQAYVGTSAPAGWLVCDGTAFSSTTYPALYALLGNVATTPDLRDRFVVGASATKTIRTTGGSATIGLNNLPAHTHPNTASWSGSASVSISDPGHNHGGNTGSTDINHNHSLPDVRRGTSSVNHDGSTTIAAGFAANLSPGTVYLNTSTAGGSHTHTIASGTTGITATSSVSGTVTMNNQPNATTASDYWQPYYAVTYIIKAA